MQSTPSRRRSARFAGDRLKQNERQAVGKAFFRAQQHKKRRRPRTKLKVPKWLERHELSDRSLAILCLGILLVLHYSRYYYKPNCSTDYPSLKGTTAEFRRVYQSSRHKVLANKQIYDDTYQLATARRISPDETTWPEYERKNTVLSNSYGKGLEACPLTIVVTDTKLGKPKHDFGPGQPLWFALESIGAFASDACVLLQTTTCEMENYLSGGSPLEESKKEIANVIYDNSLPLFRRLIDSGRVRISFLDREKYKFASCHDFDDPSRIRMNHLYWETEFLDQDSDLVVVFDGESSLCYPIPDLDDLRKYAFTAAVWPREPDRFTPEPFEGICRGMPNAWNTWLQPRRWSKALEETPEAGTANTEKPPVRVAPEPNPIPNEDFPADVCRNGRGPLGHGATGLSIRSRKWMTRAIEACPHASRSGLALEDDGACRVSDPAVGEDFYFATVLAGLGAPLPSAQRASLFAVGKMWPEEVIESFGVPADASWRSLGRPSVSVAGTDLTVPAALHRPWWYHPNELLRSPPLRHACPFLPYTFTPSMSRFGEGYSVTPE